MVAAALSWTDLEAEVAGHPARTGEGRSQGPCNAQARLRLFGQPEGAVRVTLYRDHHAWCPYCQKVWLWLEERRIPYRVEKVTMFCYGEKEAWYRRLVPSGMLPALALDGQLVTESDRILEVLEQAFGSLGPGMGDPAVLPLRRLERLLFRAWCQWLCVPHGSRGDAEAREAFRQWAGAMEQALAASGGPFLLGSDLGTADLVFVPYLERMNASLAYYKGYLLRQEHPAIDRWFWALERRPSYRGTQSDFHTHAHDLPPQMGGCHANGSAEQRRLAARIDQGPWPILGGDQADPETSEPGPGQADPSGEPSEAARIALARVLRHRDGLLNRNPLGAAGFDLPLRTALTNLIRGAALAPPAGSAGGLRHLRDRISVPRDMPLHAGRLLRQALEGTAARDPGTPAAQGQPIPAGHRRDQDPRPFLQAALAAGLALVGSLSLGASAIANPLIANPLLSQPTAGRPEQEGRAFFRRPPWRVDLVSNSTTVGEPWAEYFFTVELPAEAGASLGGLSIRQTRGADRSFPFSPERTRAFLGRPRQRGAAVPVEASFDSDARLIQVRFPEPVPPGATVTVRLKPWTNPNQADTYLFQVTALPAGPNPQPAPLGVATLRIYQRNWR